MSFFRRSKQSKASSSQEKTSQTSGDDVKAVSASRLTGQDMESCDMSTSLFSGMTFTSLPLTATREDLNLKGHTNLMPTKKQLSPTGTLQPTFPDFTTSITKSDSKLLPEPIQPTPINTQQQSNQITTKKKRTRNFVRPGYARQPETTACEITAKTWDVSEEKSCENKGEEDVSKEDDENSEISQQDQVLVSCPQTPLYSIGTPSTSEENLNQDFETNVDTNGFILSEETAIDDLSLDIPNQRHSLNELEGSSFSKGRGSDEKPVETSFDESSEVSIPLVSKGIIYSSELNEKFSDEIENSVLDSCLPLRTDDAQNDALERQMVEMQTKLQSNEESDLQQETSQLMDDDHPCASTMEASGEGTTPVTDAHYTSCVNSSNKLNFALQSIDLKLASLSEDKKSVTSIEEELFHLYSETENDKCEKKHQITELQKEESQALANDSYDLAENISNRIDQLKADLESSHYRLPANDKKVERALKLRAEIAEKEAAIYRDSQGSLQHLHEEHGECLKKHLEITASWSSREKQHLSSERQRLERAKDHLHLDKEHVEAEHLELNKEILDQTKEFQKRKDELAKERGSLQDEIAALEERLAKLRETEADLTEAIQKEENKMESVQNRFIPQQRRLDKQKHEIEAREKALQEEFDSLQSTQNQFDEQTAENRSKEKELTSILSAASEGLNKFKDTISELEEEQSRVQEFLNMEHFDFVTDAKLTSLNIKQKELSQQIKNLSNSVQMKQRSADTLRKRLNLTEAQIFDLDAAKEIAKQDRNFKEAKRLKEERDAMHQDGIKGQEELESLLKKIAEDKKSLEEYEQESNELDMLISEQDGVAALATVEKAAVISQQLQEKIKRMRENNLVRRLLEIEVKTCLNVISDLCQKHGISMPVVDKTQIGIPEEDKEITNATLEEPKIKQCEVLEESTEDKTELLERFNELEAKLEAAVEVEDFDEADRLQQEITKVKKMIE
ncbi:putative leucine-rich repeat-containing protein DDB_G0290503 [Acropora muricata]|uniref:putative leucine-rich repeat-containing protein DDB_G0290503 n=1 Tax=Acropora muricata TaxID=159855 RepID=UPI0034E570C6